MTKSRISVRQILGELLLTAGVLLLLFAFYEAFWTNVASGQLQQEAQAELDEQWRNPREELNPELGEAIAKMHIPAFGSDFEFAIIEGTDENDLLRGPGHYENTQMPGEVGNFAVAGHRVGKGAPFNDLGALDTCDEIIIETATRKITYRVLPIDGAPADCLRPTQQAKLDGEYSMAGRHITTPGDVGVIAAQPVLADAPPTESILTLTTCHPQFSNAERMIVHAMETSNNAKA